MRTPGGPGHRMHRTGLSTHGAASARSQGTACPRDAANRHLSPLPSPFPQHQLLTAGRGPSVAPCSHETASRRCRAPQTSAPGWVPGKAAGAMATGEQVAEQGSSYLSKGRGPYAGCPNKGTAVPREGPGTPRWRRSGAKRVLGTDSAPGCQVPVRRPRVGLASEGPRSWHRQLGGCFCRRAGPGGRSREGVPCVLRAGACADERPRMSGRGGESGWGDGDLGGRACQRAGRHKDTVASRGRAGPDLTARASLLLGREEIFAPQTCPGCAGTALHASRPRAGSPCHVGPAPGQGTWAAVPSGSTLPHECWASGETQLGQEARCPHPNLAASAI